ncbi:hypothetical protein G5714_024601 [Onychostoma macrolepis]|uniref:Uncharacterized protein n=1 Tax=Onychostoma macrolepis TaxID=369639 RepID=A0A7J6BHX7_9TELE|nr:hypothetical protein G5714_024601 [Onychostoma macrolepis]
MFGHDICLVSALLAAAGAVLPALLLLVVSRLLWEFRWSITRDRTCKLPLRRAPWAGRWSEKLFTGFSRREKHGNVFKTHLLGKPLIRVTGAENIRKILLGEHSLVCTQWPQSTRIILGPNTLVNSVGDLHKRKRKGIRAREILHSAMEKIIEEKLKKQQTSDYCDAFDYMLSSAKEDDYELTMQELKETAVELIFAAHSTTASASTSLILQLLRHPDVSERQSTPEQSWKARAMNKTSCFEAGDKEEGYRSRTHVPYLSLEKLSQLSYLDCVVKEVLRFLPPVSGGYRTVLQTFELNGYQIPKGWSVMYSIRDTQTAEAYQNPELFDPDRFCADRNESKTDRFSYVPFGGGVRRCVGGARFDCAQNSCGGVACHGRLHSGNRNISKDADGANRASGQWIACVFNYRTHGVERNRRSPRI